MDGGRIRTCQEAVELDEELEVDVLALGRFAVRIAHMMVVEIDTCRMIRSVNARQNAVVRVSGRGCERPCGGRQGTVSQQQRNGRANAKHDMTYPSCR